GRRAGMQARPLPRHGRTEHSRAHATASAQIDPSRRGRNSEPLVDAATSLLQLLAHPNIASKEDIIRRFDHEVQGGTIIKPLVGRAGPSDAAVLRPLRGSWRGAVLAHGINPLYGELDPHAMAMLAVDEALRNLVAVGGSIDHVAMLDNFCWGDVDDPDGLGALVRAAQGCRDAALRYEVPFISGKDSLRNTSADADGTHSIPGTLLISAVGVVNDVRCCVTMNLQAAGSSMYLLGATGDELGGSHFHEIHGLGGGTVPGVRRETPALMRRLTRAIDEQLVLSCHDLSEGGLAVAAAEMALAGGLGLDLDLERVPRSTESIEVILFSESPGRFLLEVADEQAARFEDLFEGLPYACIGRVRADERFIARQAGEVVINLGLPELDTAWRTPLLPPPLPAVPAPRSVDGEEVADRRSRSSTPRAGNARVRALILTAPGINCDGETVEACRMAGADAEPVHLKWLLDDECSLDDFGMLVLPGGFSYGDHLGAGSMLATVLRNRLLPDLLRFVADGRPVLGICNGFQVLARLGLLGPISLARNNTDRFECRWVPLRVEPSSCPFLDGLEDIDLPIAHGQGRVVIPADCLAKLLPLAPLRYRRNPNGSTADIAGIYSPEGNVLGLMPHPERYLTPYHHPDRVKTAPAGLRIFENMIRYVREMP
ncbi:MAG TPA: phosphoribosylformylglycinamidine synthase I, partial [Chloroflexota bacterium]